jgi:hypothetical protein
VGAFRPQAGAQFAVVLAFLGLFPCRKRDGHVSRGEGETKFLRGSLSTLTDAPCTVAVVSTLTCPAVAVRGMGSA